MLAGKFRAVHETHRLPLHPQADTSCLVGVAIARLGAVHNASPRKCVYSIVSGGTLPGVSTTRVVRSSVLSLPLDTP